MSIVSGMNINEVIGTNNSNESRLTSVEETFSKYSISQIQQMTKNYKNKANNAKSELYDLVGSKYRDLIKIAEDIGDMYSNSQDINHKLSNLSYSSSKFVSFDSNSYASYYTNKRIQDAKVVREKERLTILNILISDNLLQIHMKLKSSSIPFVHTSVILHHAKLFCTIEYLFEDLLSDKNTLLGKKYFNLKNSLLDYLEEQISKYNPSSNSLYSTQNDVLRSSDLLQIEEIVNNHGIIIDKVDAYLDDGDLYMDDISDSDDSIEREYNKTLNPLIHFLSAYIILNHKNKNLNSLSQIFERFFELRCTYLKNVFEFALESKTPTFIDFSKALKYIENTLGYSMSYFKNKENELIQNIKSYANTWNGTSIISYHSWFSDDRIDLRLIDVFDKNIPKTLIDKKENEMINTLVDFTKRNIKTNSNDLLLSASDAFLVFHNFVYCLQSLNNKRIENDSKSYLVETLSNGKNDRVLQFLFEDLKEILMHLYNDKIGELNCQSSGITFKFIKALENLNYNTIPITNPLFTDKSLTIMDSDLNEYIKSISKFSLNSPDEEVSKYLNKWFDELIRFKELLTLNEDANFNKISAVNCIEHLSKVLGVSEKAGSNLAFSKISKSSLISEFNKMSSSLEEKLLIELRSFIEQIHNVLDTKNKDFDSDDNLEPIYYIIRLLLILKEKIIVFKSSSTKTKELLNKLDDLISHTYKNVFKIVMNTSFNDNFTKFLTNMNEESKRLSDDLPLRPSLYLSSLMYKLCKQLLSLSNKGIQYEFGTLFVNEISTELYTPIKNEWISTFLVHEKILGSLTEAKITPEISNIEQKKEEDKIEDTVEDNNDKINELVNNEKNNKELTQNFLYIFANILFLLQFTNPDSIIDMENENVKKVLEKFHELDAGKYLNETSIQFIIKGVYDFFKSNKGLYLPLSI